MASDLTTVVSLGSTLHRSSRLLQQRLEMLESRLAEADESAWREYAGIAQALATVIAAIDQVKPQSLLTTKEMAERLGVSPQTLLRRKRTGELSPAVAVGKFIRWSGNEALGIRLYRNNKHKPRLLSTAQQDRTASHARLKRAK